MAQTIYASFADVAQAEKAAGALLDYGVQKEDISLVANDSHGRAQTQEVGRVDSGMAYATDSAFATSTYATASTAGSVPGGGAVIIPAVTTPSYSGTTVAPISTFQTGADYDATGTDRLDYDASKTDRYGDVATTDSTATDAEAIAKSGITTTTPEDAGEGAVKGTAYGLGLGLLAGLASLLIPGVGLVVGGGALATALGGAALAAGAGAAAGGVAGYLKDQGIPETDAQAYHAAVQGGGALLAVNLPSNNVDVQSAQIVLNKYGAADVSAY